MQPHHSNELQLFADAIARLDEALLAMGEYPTVTVVRDSLIKRFEFTYEMAIQHRRQRTGFFPRRSEAVGAAHDRNRNGFMSATEEHVCAGITIRPHWLAMVQDILGQYVSGREVRAFGSRVAGGSRPFSDLDIAICGAEPLNDTALLRLREALEESDLPIEVDVVPLQTAARHILDAVARHSVVIQSGTSPLDTDGTQRKLEK